MYEWISHGQYEKHCSGDVLSLAGELEQDEFKALSNLTHFILLLNIAHLFFFSDFADIPLVPCL